MVGAEPRMEAYLLTDPGRVSTIKTRYLAAGQQLLRTDHETSEPLSESIADDLQRAAVDAEGEIGSMNRYAKDRCASSKVSIRPGGNRFAHPARKNERNGRARVGFDRQRALGRERGRLRAR